MSVLDLTGAEVRALPLDDLALRVLAHLRVAAEWNWKNFMGLVREHYHRDWAVVGAFSEAIAWLRNQGLLVWNPQQDSAESILISRAGLEALDRGAAWLRASQRLDIDLVPELEAKARPQFLLGDFEAAAFMAMKEVEVRVRDLSRLPKGLVGRDLMNQAFRPPKNGTDSGGPLFQAEDEAGESSATMALFAGAIGLFKNPASHRRVDFADPTEAVEVVLLADLLMRLLRKIPAATA